MPTPCSVLEFYRDLLARRGEFPDEDDLRVIAASALLTGYDDLEDAKDELRDLAARKFDPEDVIGSTVEGYMFTANDLEWAIDVMEDGEEEEGE